MRSLLISAILFAATPVLAQAPAPAMTRAVLADAAKAPSGRTIIDGAAWRCEQTSCTASGGANQPASRACRRVVARFGVVTEFVWKGEALGADALAVCNG